MPCKIIVEIVEIAFLGNERSADFNCRNVILTKNSK